jgi:hypothetical protein
MGNYTGIRGKVVIKECFVDSFDKAFHGKYFEWSQAVACDSEAFTEFASNRRSSFIPFGAVCYIDWDEHRSFNKGSRELHFSCSVKDDGTAEEFIYCLPDIADSWEVETLYEYAKNSVFHNSSEGIV